MKRGKKVRAAYEKIDRNTMYSLEEAVKLLKELHFTKFDESLEIAINLNIQQKHTVRDTTVLPHGTGKKVRILVFAKADKAKEAEEAGADFVGDTDIIEKIKEGWFDFDVSLATPDMMKEVGKIGQLLGKRGLMPNPKTQTVTNDIKTAVAELRKGRVEFRADKTRIVHLGVGKLSMEDGMLVENCTALYESVLHKRPSDLKGEYIQSVFLSSSMGPGIKIDHKAIA
ncbi:MAG: 50S ribosomal protein L1 [Spirochaetes bacterium DG_61]|nr:MAG: 50S ribosomal protein L1 [Spirochaetes bacterium DG_61]